MAYGWELPGRLWGALRSRAAVTARLREIAPLHSWRNRSLLDLLGLNGATLLETVKIAVSASLSWALAQLLLHSPSPIWAPITASLVALLTVRASVRDAIQRVFGVVLGMVVAVWLSGLVGLHAVTVGLIVAIGFVVGKVLRLIPAAAAQIPINGLFILALGSNQSTQRVLDTVIGAVTAVVVNFVIAPPNHVKTARRGLAELADEVVDVLSTMAAGIARPWRREQAAGWLRTARGNAGRSMSAETDLEQAAESLRLHPGRSNWTGPLRSVRQATETLRTVEVQVRVVARTLRDTADDLAVSGDRQSPLPMAAEMLANTACAIEAFAQALLADGVPHPSGSVGGTGRQPLDMAARAAIDRARRSITDISTDVRDMVAMNVNRGIYLGTLVVETTRIVDELDAGLRAAAVPTERAETNHKSVEGT